FDFLARFLGLILIRDCRPAEIDRGLCNCLFYYRRTLAHNRCGDHRRSHNDGFTPNNRPRLLDRDIDLQVALTSKSLHGLATYRAHFIVTRTLVHDRRVVVSDVGDVGRLIDDRHIALGWDNRGLDPLRAKFSARNEAILVGTDIVVTVGPIVDAGALIESRFRWQGRPANVIVTLAPRNPRRRPFISGNPDPTDAAQTRPTSVVISGPAKCLFGNPGPTGIGVNPAPIRIWPPTARAFRLTRLPNVTIIARLDPRAVRLKFVVKG